MMAVKRNNLIYHGIQFLFVVNFLLPDLEAYSTHYQNNADQIYGATGLNVASDNVQTIKTLFNNLSRASSAQLIDIAQQLKKQLEHDLKSTKEDIAAKVKHNEPIPDTLFYKEFILQEQLTHFEDFISFKKSGLSSWAQIKHFFLDWYDWALSRLGTEKTTSDALIDQEVLRYISFERERILFDYDKLLLFLELKKRYPLPKFIDFWDTPEKIEKLKRRAKQLKPPTIQWAALLASLVAQGVIMAGGQMARQWVDDDSRTQFQELDKQQKQIAAGWQSFQQTQKKDREDAMKKITKKFSDSIKALQKDYDQTNASLQAEILYLNRSVNLAEPIDHYLCKDPAGCQIIWDEFFEKSPMLVPPNSLPWYNIYQINESDWEFDPVTNSFWQYALTPYPVPPLWKKTDGTWLDDPASNSIFNEYANGRESYIIEIELLLANVTYPFFAGIMFNRAHWISGVPERVSQYRLIGLYGDQINQKSQISLGFAQQIIKSAQEIISPLQQIATDPATQWYKLTDADANALVRNPLTFIIKMTVSPTMVQCEFTKKIGDSKSVLFTKTVEKLDKDIFKFSGIGFIASGCQAAFKILQPKELVYSDAQIDAFKKMLTTMVP